MTKAPPTISQFLSAVTEQTSKNKRWSCSTFTIIMNALVSWILFYRKEDKHGKRGGDSASPKTMV